MVAWCTILILYHSNHMLNLTPFWKSSLIFLPRLLLLSPVFVLFFLLFFLFLFSKIFYISSFFCCCWVPLKGPRTPKNTKKCLLFNLGKNKGPWPLKLDINYAYRSSVSVWFYFLILCCHCFCGLGIFHDAAALSEMGKVCYAANCETTCRSCM